jgi:hypothetical protein
MTKSIQSLAAQAGREARANGLPAGEHTYTNKCEDQEAYRVIEAMIPRAEYEAKREAKCAAEHAERRVILLEAGIDIGEYKPYYKGE